MSLSDLVTVTISIDPETQARTEAELDGRAAGRVFRHTEETYDALQEVVPGPMRSGLWAAVYRPHFRTVFSLALSHRGWAFASLAGVP